MAKKSKWSKKKLDQIKYLKKIFLPMGISSCKIKEIKNYNVRRVCTE